MSQSQADDKASRGGQLRKHTFKLLSGSVVLLLGIATVAYHFLEGWGWVDSFYFSTVAVTTVGFGDLTPSTSGSKLFTVFYVVTGIGIVTTYLNERFHRLSDRVSRHRQDSAS